MLRLFPVKFTNIITIDFIRCVCSVADQSPLRSHSHRRLTACRPPALRPVCPHSSLRSIYNTRKGHYDKCNVHIHIYISISKSYNIYDTKNSKYVGCTLTTTTNPAPPSPVCSTPVHSSSFLSLTASVLNCHNKRFYCSMKRERYGSVGSTLLIYLNVIYSYPVVCMHLRHAQLLYIVKHNEYLDRCW